MRFDVQSWHSTSRRVNVALMLIVKRGMPYKTREASRVTFSMNILCVKYYKLYISTSVEPSVD